MKTKNLIATALISAGLAFGITAQAGEKKHEEQSISIGVQIDANGKVLSKHNEAQEHKEGEKY